MSVETAAQDHCAVGIITAVPWRVRAVTVLPGFRLAVTCNDGVSGVVEMSQLVAGEHSGIYAALRDEKLFSQVRIELGALTWTNGADLDPEWTHEELAKNPIWMVPG
jgi:hypothetical protein